MPRHLPLPYSKRHLIAREMSERSQDFTYPSKASLMILIWIVPPQALFLSLQLVVLF